MSIASNCGAEAAAQEILAKVLEEKKTLEMLVVVDKLQALRALMIIEATCRQIVKSAEGGWY